MEEVNFKKTGQRPNAWKEKWSIKWREIIAKNQLAVKEPNRFYYFSNFRGSHRRCYLKKVVLQKLAKFLGKQLCNFEACNFIRKGKVAHVFQLILNSFEHVFFYEYFFTWKPRAAAFWNRQVLPTLFG